MKPLFVTPGRRNHLAAVLLALAAAGAVEAKTVTYSYYRFRATAIRGTGDTIIQLSELNLFNSAAGATPLVPATATDSTNDNSGDGLPGNAIDNKVSTKWLNFNYATGFLTVGFTAPQAVDSYNYYTGNDEPERDPVSWILEGANDSAGPWTTVDAVNNVVPASGRSALAFPANFSIPDSPPGIINEFGYNDPTQSNIIANGSELLLYVDAEGQSLDISSSAGGAPQTVTTGSIVSVKPPDNAYTTYTLTAHSAGGNTTRSVSIRTVQGPTLSYRYIRYTPQKVVSGTTIDLSDLSFRKAGVRVPIAAVENPGGTSADPTSINNLIDDPVVNPGTEYVSALSPVIFDLGSAPVSYDSFSFTTGLDVDLAPLRWTIEGSNDKSGWTLVQNVNFDFNASPYSNTESAAIPFDGTAATPFVSLSSNAVLSVSGEPVELTYSVLGAASGILQPGSITLTGSGVYTAHPTANTTYTLSANATGGSAQASVTQVVLPSIPTSFSFANFEDAALIHTVGDAKVLNDYAHFSAAGNVKRLRLTEDAGSQHGAAWYLAPIAVKNGFDTSYDAFIESASSPYGADGLAFVIQNTATGLETLNGNQVHVSGNAVSVTLDSFPDVAGESGFASLEVWKGDTLAKVVNLASLGLAHGGTYLADYAKPAANPYHVRVVYTPPVVAGGDGALTVYVDSTKALDSYAVNLESAGAVDANGRGYVGFVARTGGFSEVHDITSWSLTTTSSSGTTTPLAITSSSFDTTGHTLTLNYSATAGQTYRVTTSTDLVTWTPVAGTSGTVAASASGSFSFGYTAGTRGYFRVEQVTP